MIITNYYDFVLVVDSVDRNNLEKQYSVRVVESPAGESKNPEFVSPIPSGLQRKIKELEKRKLQGKLI